MNIYLRGPFLDCPKEMDCINIYLLQPLFINDGDGGDACRNGNVPACTLFLGSARQDFQVPTLRD